LSARNLLLFGILIAAAIGSWYLSRVRGDEDSSQLGVDPVHRGFYLKSARILGTGPDGDLLYELRASHAEEQLDGSIEFTLLTGYGRTVDGQCRQCDHPAGARARPVTRARQGDQLAGVAGQ
jgi:hypothetical protein